MGLASETSPASLAAAGGAHVDEGLRRGCHTQTNLQDCQRFQRRRTKEPQEAFFVAVVGWWQVVVSGLVGPL